MVHQVQQRHGYAGRVASADMRIGCIRAVMDQVERTHQVVGGFLRTHDVAPRAEQIETVTAVPGAIAAREGMGRQRALLEGHNRKHVEIRAAHVDPVCGEQIVISPDVAGREAWIQHRLGTAAPRRRFLARTVKAHRSKPIVKRYRVEIEVAVLIMHGKKVIEFLARRGEAAQAVPAALFLPCGQYVGVAVVVAVKPPAVEMNIGLVDPRRLQRAQAVRQLVEGLQAVIVLDAVLVKQRRFLHEMVESAQMHHGPANDLVQAGGTHPFLGQRHEIALFLHIAAVPFRHLHVIAVVVEQVPDRAQVAYLAQTGVPARRNTRRAALGVAIFAAGIVGSLQDGQYTGPAVKLPPPGHIKRPRIAQIAPRNGLRPVPRQQHSLHARNHRHEIRILLRDDRFRPPDHGQVAFVFDRRQFEDDLPADQIGAEPQLKSRRIREFRQRDHHAHGIARRKGFDGPLGRVQEAEFLPAFVDVACVRRFEAPDLPVCVHLHRKIGFHQA